MVRSGETRTSVSLLDDADEEEGRMMADDDDNDGANADVVVIVVTDSSIGSLPHRRRGGISSFCLHLVWWVRLVSSGF